MSLGRAVDIVMQIANVLVAAHQIGLVHRDLKPENVFLEKNVDGTDRVVVVDFGLAYIEDRADATRMTKEGVIAGTPAYMSPEQCQGKGVGTPADVYALGCMLYEMAVGSVPFEGASFQLLIKHSFEEPQPPSQRRRDVYVPRVLEELILEMLAKGPELRPNAETVVTRLGKLAVTLGERERSRGSELLQGRAARMIPTVRPPEDPAEEGMRPTAVPTGSVPPSRAFVVLGTVGEELMMGLRANGLAPLAVAVLPVPEGATGVFAPGADDAMLKSLVALGIPVLTDADPEDADRSTRMIGLGVADVVPKPVRVEALASKAHRAIKKAARRAR
jgi:serine/threonine-protein kinase